VTLDNRLKKIYPSRHKNNKKGDKSALKINCIFQLITGIAIASAFCPQVVNENLCNFVNPDLKGILYVFDLQYTNFSTFQAIMSLKSFFVCKVKSNATPIIISSFIEEDTKLIRKSLKNIKKALTKLKRTHCDFLVRLHNVKDNVRLVGVKVGKKWYLYYTNINFLSPKAISLLYSLRWQIEIFFRDIKSVLRFDQFVFRKPNAMKSEFLGMLILYLIIRILNLKAIKEGRIPHYSNPTPLQTISLIHSISFAKAFCSLRDAFRHSIRFLLKNSKHFVKELIKSYFKTLPLCLSKHIDKKLKNLLYCLSHNLNAYIIKPLALSC
jgi:hypothetical protein